MNRFLAGILSCSLLSLLFASGCGGSSTSKETTDSTSSAGDNSNPQPSATSPSTTALSGGYGATYTPATTASQSPNSTAQSAATPKISGTVKTNVYGATLTIQNSAEEKVFQGQFLPGKMELNYQFEKSDGPFTYQVTLAGVAAIEPKQSPSSGKAIDLPFDAGQLAEIRRAAACLLMIPGGGFGSGFLLGDRQSIATAAHCVACKNVEELEIVFHPTEDKEKKVVGAKLIYFDAKQDVALLHLPEAMEDDRPYFWKAESAKQEDDVVILGNPGRNGQPDPMYSRSATVKGTRADEFFVDIEVKPGYSGGPVILDGGMDVVGITSFKYVNTRDYKKDGLSFAKSADIASDAFEHWDALSSRLKEQKLEREADRYQRRYHYVIANEAAEALLLDSLSYTFALIDIANDYTKHVNSALKDLPNPVSESRFRREEKKAHDAYIKEYGPKKAAQIKERISPKLKLEQYYGDVYKEAIEDEGLPEDLKEHLRKAHEHYSNLREAAETVVDSSKKSSKGKTLKEFLEWGIEELKSVDFHADSVMMEAQSRLE